jgi:hypothetical protein
MQCSVCGSQDTTLKQGISKTGKNAGKLWKAYDCNEAQCKNEKGYPSRTFVPMARPQGAKADSGSPLGDMKTIVTKLDKILAILEKNFGKTVIAVEEPEETESPFYCSATTPQD